MPRIHAPEIEDQDWCPALVRDALTDLLTAAAVRLRIFDPALPVLATLCRQVPSPQIVDLCSGAGGPLLALLPQLRTREGLEPRVVLTDKFPNHAALAAAERRFPGQVQVWPRAVDATQVPAQLRGVRTIFNAFHHFRPEQARAILADAVRKRQPIAVFETVGRGVTEVPFVLGVPWFVWAMTPFGRISASRLALTYLLPVIPLAAMWDAFASNLRAYSPEELEELVASVQQPTYRFTIGFLPLRRVPGRMTVLVGVPVSGRSNAVAFPGLRDYVEHVVQKGRQG